MFAILMDFPFKKFGLSLTNWNLSKDVIKFLDLA